jgi:hypothetical protein
MDHKEQEAEVEYAKLLIEDEGKTFLDILPAEFKTYKRSLIKREIIDHIGRITKLLNESPVYKDMKFTEFQVTRYMLARRKNFYLAWKYIPNRTTLDLRFDDNYKKMSEEEKIKIREFLNEMSQELSWLMDSWKMWEQRQRIKQGKSAHDFDMDEDENGIPRTSRGNLCSIYTAVKGKWLKNQKGPLKLFNPRNKKTITLTIEKFVESENVYVCLDNKGKKIFLTDYESVDDSWDALFAANKEIFSGWWNKILIWK